MTKALPHVTTDILGQLDKSLFLVPWANRLGVEFMQEKTIEFVGDSITKILTEIEEMTLVKSEVMVEKLKKIIADTEKAFGGDESKIAQEAKKQPTIAKDFAAERGKRAHTAIEDFLNATDGAQIDVDQDLVKPFKKFVEWWIFNDVEVVEIECPVWSDEGGGYKGRFDLAANLKEGGKKLLYLLDFKTTPKIYDDVKMQLAAYFYGWKQRTKYIPDRAGVLRIDFTDGPEEFLSIPESELYREYQKFLRLVELWHLNND